PLEDAIQRRTQLLDGCLSSECTYIDPVFLTRQSHVAALHKVQFHLVADTIYVMKESLYADIRHLRARIPRGETPLQELRVRFRQSSSRNDSIVAGADSFEAVFAELDVHPFARRLTQ